MIYVECRPDELLVRQVTDLPRRQVVHEAKRVFLKHVILSRSGAQAKNLTTLTVGWSGDASGFALSMTGCLSSGNTFENTL